MALQLVEGALGFLCNLGSLKYIAAPFMLLVPCNILNCILCLVTLLPIYFTKPSKLNSVDGETKDFRTAFGYTCLFYFVIGIILWELIAFGFCAVVSKTQFGKLGSFSGQAANSLFASSE